MYKGLKHIFFDLDNTIWDFDANSSKALEQLYLDHALASRGIPGPQVFIARYQQRNEELWKAYREGNINQEKLRWLRYFSTLADFGLEDKGLSLTMSKDYLDLISEMALLVEGAREVLDSLVPHFKLHIITNGFEEVQVRKIFTSDLNRYFDVVVTSEKAGALKPASRIFLHALEEAGAVPSESLYVGDKAEVDGACMQVGMHFVHFNRSKNPDEEQPFPVIGKLAELLSILRAPLQGSTA